MATNDQQSQLEIVELSAAVAKLSRRVDSLEKARATEESVSDDESLQAIEAVQRATEALFAARVVMEQRQDPELDEKYFVARVATDCTPEQVAERYRQWHRKLGDWAPRRECEFRLAVEFVDDK